MPSPSQSLRGTRVLCSLGFPTEPGMAAQGLRSAVQTTQPDLHRPEGQKPGTHRKAQHRRSPGQVLRVSQKRGCCPPCPHQGWGCSAQRWVWRYLEWRNSRGQSVTKQRAGSRGWKPTHNIAAGPAAPGCLCLTQWPDRTPQQVHSLPPSPADHFTVLFLIVLGCFLELSPAPEVAACLMGLGL